MLVNLNACLWLLSLSGWSLLNLLLVFTCPKRDTACASTSINPKLFHMSPSYLPICGIYLWFQVNLHVPNPKPSNDNLFCMLESLLYQLGLSISSMLGGLFSRWVDSAHHSREMAGNWDAQSHDQKIEIKNNCKQNSPRTVVGIDGTRCFGPAVECACWWWGSINFTILFGNRL